MSNDELIEAINENLRKSGFELVEATAPIEPTELTPEKISYLLRSALGTPETQKNADGTFTYSFPSKNEN